GPLGTPDHNPAGYAHVSPQRYFRRGQPPVLLVQGTADEQIPAAWTTATYRALRHAGVTTRLVWIPGAPHIMAGADLAAENAAAEAWIRHAPGSGAPGAAAPRRGGGARGADDLQPAWPPRCAGAAGPDEAVRMVDAATGVVRRVVALGQGPGPGGMTLDARRGRLFVTNYVAGTVRVLDTTSGRLLRTIRVGGSPRRLAVDERTGRV